MVILVSDLHLADTPNRATIDVKYFLRQITAIVERAAQNGIKTCHLVLLGDIFEILKSERWIDQKVRPWEASTDEHVNTVASIFAAIDTCNEEFFEGLRTLLKRESPEMHLQYVPGNHDRPLNTEMGVRAREHFQRLVPLPYTGNKTFNERFINKEHALIAKHGHRWDPVNRYGPETAAIGDAIVIDILLKLPSLVKKNLQLDEYDASFEFLHELDNVRPHHPRVMAQWLMNGLASMEVKHPKARTAFQTSCEKIIEEFRALQERTRQERVVFETFDMAAWWLNFLALIVETSVKTFGTINLAELIPSPKVENDPYGELAVNDLEEESRIGTDYRYVVCGHTHVPSVVPLNVSGRRADRACLYLNTGTWRRVHKVASTTPSRTTPTAFASWDEECTINLYSEEEQREFKHPAYEFSRLTRGAYI